MLVPQTSARKRKSTPPVVAAFSGKKQKGAPQAVNELGQGGDGSKAARSGKGSTAVRRSTSNSEDEIEDEDGGMDPSSMASKLAVFKSKFIFGSGPWSVSPFQIGPPAESWSGSERDVGHIESLMQSFRPSSSVN